MSGERFSPPPSRPRRPFLRGCLIMVLVLGGVFVLLGVVSRMDGFFFLRGEKVGVLTISGLVIDSEATIEQRKKFARDDSVKAIVVRLNTPGGGVGPSQEIHEEVRKIRGKKVILASMGALADGRILAGEQAKELGLIDALGNLEDAVAEAGKMAKIEGEPRVVTLPKKKFSFLDLLREEAKSIIDEKLTQTQIRLDYLAQ